MPNGGFATSMATRSFLALRIFSSVLSANAGCAANITDASASVAIAKRLGKLLMSSPSCGENPTRVPGHGPAIASRFRCVLLCPDHLQRSRIELLLDQSHVLRHGAGRCLRIPGGDRPKYLVVLLKRQ